MVIATRLLIATLLAGTALGASAAVDTTDYDRLRVLPALTGNLGDQDWRARGAVTSVKNEGGCDASWAFGVSELVESDHAIRNGTLLSLSPQELLDCTGSGSGCNGGSPISALRTVIAKGGLATTASYPYTATIGACKASTPAATVPGAGLVPSGDEVSLQNYVARGPVLALIDDSNPAFNAYHGGIFTGPCSNSRPTRAVLIVGYTSGYWIVKNSLGTSWGAQGYVYMARHQNICGIDNYALAISNDPLPAPVVPTIPALSPWAVAFLLGGFLALGFALLRVEEFRSNRRTSAAKNRPDADCRRSQLSGYPTCI
jgi:cathepsin L